MNINPNLSLFVNEVSVLLLQLNYARKKIKKAFKKQYDKGTFKANMSRYDSLVDQIKLVIEESSLEALETDQGVRHIDLNTEQLHTLSNFLDWYVPQADEAFGKGSEEDRYMITQLKSIREKVYAVKEIHQVV